MSVQKFIRASMQEENRQAPATTSAGEPFTDFDTDHHSAVCAGCSCLCDDISYYVKEGEVVRTLNLCEVGWRRIHTVSAEDRLPPPSPSLFEDDLKQAARLLRSHRPVLVLGADSVDEVAIRASLQLARELQGVWLPWPFAGLRRFYETARRVGWATALLDDVRDRADLVVFWRADPLVTHHRHLSRYSFFARGRFTERGNLDRSLAAVASEKTVMEPLCQHYIRVPDDRDLALIEALVDPRTTGHAFDPRDFTSLAGALERSSYIALFFDPERVEPASLDAMFRWSAKLNAEGRQRMVILPLWNAGSNIEGFCRVSLEENATPWGADFSGITSGGKTPEMGWEDLLDRVGSVLAIPSGTGPAQGLGLPECLGEKPRVVIDPFKRVPQRNGDVVIPAALPGFESDGVFFRADGIPLVARRPRGLRDHGYPTVKAVFSGIQAEGP